MLALSDKPALSIIIVKINVLNSNFVTLERRIIDLDETNNDIHVKNDVTTSSNGQDPESADDITVSEDEAGCKGDKTLRVNRNPREIEMATYRTHQPTSALTKESQ